MKFLKLLAVSAAIALTACGDDNVAAFDEPPMSSQDVSSQDPVRMLTQQAPAQMRFWEVPVQKQAPK